MLVFGYNNERIEITTSAPNILNVNHLDEQDTTLIDISNHSFDNLFLENEINIHDNINDFEINIHNHREENNTISEINTFNAREKFTLINSKSVSDIEVAPVYQNKRKRNVF